LSSFTRTIPTEKGQAYVTKVLSRPDHFIPLAYRPIKARSGDFIYLVFRGVIVGRARISRIDPAGSAARRFPNWAKWIIWYTGRWQRPPRDIPVQGHQSVRYLETHSLGHLDRETW
jgi:hypothetical protein